MSRCRLCHKRLVRGIFRQASAIIVLGTQPACWVRNALGVDPARVTIVRNGVAPPSLPRDTTRGAGFHLVFLGNLVARKGLPDLLHALAAPALRPRAWSLTVGWRAGDSTPMRHCAESLGIASRVTFAGWISRDEAAALLARADALVLPLL